nr:MAG TPA: hypothetical protein [Caudoviricetes sp.]
MLSVLELSKESWLFEKVHLCTSLEFLFCSKVKKFVSKQKKMIRDKHI